jgi:hypothetical protein
MTACAAKLCTTSICLSENAAELVEQRLRLFQVQRVKTFAARHVTETRRPSGHRVSLSMRQSHLIWSEIGGD